MSTSSPNARRNAGVPGRRGTAVQIDGLVEGAERVVGE
jgi:hypothetical protein